MFEAVHTDASPDRAAQLAGDVRRVRRRIDREHGVAGAIVLTATVPRHLVRRQRLSFGLVGTVVNTMLGLVVVIVVGQSMPAGLLLVGPIAVVFVAYRAFLSERSKSEGLQFLYSASEVSAVNATSKAG